MEPRTFIQREVVALHRKLPPFLSKREVRFAEKNFPMEYSFYHLLKNGMKKVRCNHCDKSFIRYSEDDVCICPHCRKSLTLMECSAKYNYVYKYYYLTTASIGDYQVLRYWIVSKKVFWRKPSYFSVLGEAYQLWFNVKKCKVVIIARPLVPSSYYKDKWIFKKSLRLRQNPVNGNWRDAACDSGFAYCYRSLNIHEQVKRRGIYSFDTTKLPIDLLIKTFSYPQYETLVKAKRFDIISACSTRQILDRWQQIKIVLRQKNYTVNDWGLWCDMIDIIQYLGKDIHNPYYLCPDDLMKAHDKYLKKKQESEDYNELFGNINKYEETFVCKKAKYFGVKIQSDILNVAIQPLCSIKEFYEEGKAMGHCVYSNAYYLEDDSLVLSCKDLKGNRLATIELSLKDFKVLQCRGKYNKVPEHYQDIISLVESKSECFRECKI